MGVTPELELDLPEDWFVLDPDPADRTAALARDVHTWAGADPERRAHRDDLAAILAGFGEEADDQGALFAAVYWEPGEYGPTAANLMVLSGSRS
ncbi:MAG: hypothetical protein ACRDY7_05870, partial [Acidimicrobiia bacterium]